MSINVKEISSETMSKVAGGVYDIDESIPAVQEFIAECKKTREYMLSSNLPLSSTMGQDGLRKVFNSLGLDPILHWWGFEDIMEKYYFQAIFYPRVS